MIDNLKKRWDSPLLSSDLKRIEETFLSSSKKQTHKKIKYPRLKYLILLTGVGLAYFIFSHYTIFILPKINHRANSLLSKQWLSSLQLVGKGTVMKFYRGLIHIPLPPGKQYYLLINTKNPVDLIKNNLLLNLRILGKNFPPGDLKIAVIVRDENFFSNALSPKKISLPQKENYHFRENSLKILIDLKKLGIPTINLSRIKQIRFSFYNLWEEPVSLLIKDIKITRGEER